MLAAVSRRYPEPQGRFPRVTHPCAARGRNPALDLHVLGAPPAFVLSQDQTLSFIPAPNWLKGQNQQTCPMDQRKTRPPGKPAFETHQKMPQTAVPHRRLHIPSTTIPTMRKSVGDETRLPLARGPAGTLNHLVTGVADRTRRRRRQLLVPSSGVGKRFFQPSTIFLNRRMPGYGGGSRQPQASTPADDGRGPGRATMAGPSARIGYRPVHEPPSRPGPADAVAWARGRAGRPRGSSGRRRAPRPD